MCLKFVFNFSFSRSRKKRVYHKLSGDQTTNVATVLPTSESNDQDPPSRIRSLKVSIDLTRCGVRKNDLASMFKMSELNEWDIESLKKNFLNLVRHENSKKLNHSTDDTSPSPSCSTDKSAVLLKVFSRKRKNHDVVDKCVPRKLKSIDFGIATTKSNTSFGNHHSIKNRSKKSCFNESLPKRTNGDNDLQKSSTIISEKTDFSRKQVKIMLEDISKTPHYKKYLLPRNLPKIKKVQSRCGDQKGKIHIFPEYEDPLTKAWGDLEFKRQLMDRIRSSMNLNLTDLQRLPPNSSISIHSSVGQWDKVTALATYDLMPEYFIRPLLSGQMQSRVVEACSKQISSKPLTGELIIPKCSLDMHQSLVKLLMYVKKISLFLSKQERINLVSTIFKHITPLPCLGYESLGPRKLLEIFARVLYLTLLESPDNRDTGLFIKTEDSQTSPIDEPNSFYVKENNSKENVSWISNIFQSIENGRTDSISQYEIFEVEDDDPKLNNPLILNSMEQSKNDQNNDIPEPKVPDVEENDSKLDTFVPNEEGEVCRKKNDSKVDISLVSSISELTKASEASERKVSDVNKIDHSRILSISKSSRNDKIDSTINEGNSKKGLSVSSPNKNAGVNYSRKVQEEIAWVLSLPESPGESKICQKFKDQEIFRSMEDCAISLENIEKMNSDIPRNSDSSSSPQSGPSFQIYIENNKNVCTSCHDSKNEKHSIMNHSSNISKPTAEDKVHPGSKNSLEEKVIIFDNTSTSNTHVSTPKTSTTSINTFFSPLETSTKRLIENSRWIQLAEYGFRVFDTPLKIELDDLNSTSLPKPITSFLRVRKDLYDTTHKVRDNSNSLISESNPKQQVLISSLAESVPRNYFFYWENAIYLRNQVPILEESRCRRYARFRFILREIYTIMRVLRFCLAHDFRKLFDLGYSINFLNVQLQRLYIGFGLRYEYFKKTLPCFSDNKLQFRLNDPQVRYESYSPCLDDVHRAYNNSEQLSELIKRSAFDTKTYLIYLNQLHIFHQMGQSKNWN